MPKQKELKENKKPKEPRFWKNAKVSKDNSIGMRISKTFKPEELNEPKESSWVEEKYGVWKIISDMLDHSENGIYPTTKCYKEIDKLIDQLLQSKDHNHQILVETILATKNKEVQSEREKIIKWAKDQWRDGAILPEDLINFLK